MAGGECSSNSKLNELTVLRLNFNSLTGSIPMDIGKLAKLTYLDLDNNSLTGSFPLEITDLNSHT